MADAEGVIMESDHVPIELPDNSGRNRVMFRLRELTAGSIIITDVTITSEWFDEHRGSKPGSELAHMAIPISRDKLIRLAELLAAWQENRNPFEIDLAQEHWSRLAINIGPDPDYGSSTHKPTCRIQTDWCCVAGVAAFVVDQSCLRICHEGVASWLRLAHAALLPADQGE